MSECTTNCSILNLTTCLPIYRQERTEVFPATVDFDEDGCFDENLYLESKYDGYKQFSRVVSVMVMLFGGLGLLANALAIAVLSRPELKNCFNDILIALNTCDSLHIMFAILENIRNNFDDFYPNFLTRIFPVFHYPFYRITMCSSIFLLMGTAVERYLAVCRPHHYRTVQDKPGRSTWYILPSILAAVLMNIPRFWDTEVLTKCWDFSQCGCSSWSDPDSVSGIALRPQTTDMRRSRQYVIFYHTWFWGFTTGLVPVVCLIFLNTKIYLAMKKLRSCLNSKNQNATTTGLSVSKRNRVNQQKKDCTLSIVLIVTVIMFFIFHLPRILISVIESATIKDVVNCAERGRGFLTIWYLYVQAALQLLQVMDSSQNLPIYLCVSSSFKKVLTAHMTSWVDCLRGKKEGNISNSTTSLEGMKKRSISSPERDPAVKKSLDSVNRDGKSSCTESTMV